MKNSVRPALNFSFFTFNFSFALARFRPAALAPRVGDAGEAFALHRAGRAIRLLRPTIIFGEQRDVFDELRPLGLGHLVLEAGAGSLSVALVLDQAEPAGRPQHRGVDRDRVPAE